MVAIVKAMKVNYASPDTLALVRLTLHLHQLRQEISALATFRKEDATNFTVLLVTNQTAGQFLL